VPIEFAKFLSFTIQNYQRDAVNIIYASNIMLMYNYVLLKMST